MDLWQFAGAMRLGLYQCGQIGRALQGRVAEEHKLPDSRHQLSTAVSAADRLCQEILLLRAYEVAPEIEIYSEELAVCPPEILALFAANRHRYALILDPLDGTNDFLAGRPTYGHMLGLLDQETGRMACGLIYLPHTARLYLGVRGVGAFVAEGLWGTPRPLRPTAPPRTVDQIKRLEATDYALFERQGFTLVPPASASTAWELARVAEGEVGAAVMRHFHGHDTAMASVLIEELGGAALDEDGQPVHYVKSMPRLPRVVLSLSAEYALALSEEIKHGDTESTERKE
jgi:fructose-1,6-bisphosphatase/inositol monophosphatase family enzyme